jgi:hypothetical protein
MVTRPKKIRYSRPLFAFLTKHKGLFIWSYSSTCSPILNLVLFQYWVLLQVLASGFGLITTPAPLFLVLLRVPFLGSHGCHTMALPLLNSLLFIYPNMMLEKSMLRVVTKVACSCFSWSKLCRASVCSKNS